MADVGRRYRILEVVGEGGFGRVYKARLEDDQGFSKEVAVKIGDARAPEPVLKRFRDEARILGLVRDRAVVNVEPPTRLDGRWAVVMEYVEGASLDALLAARSRLPARVALQIVQEVSRALDSVYAAPGPDGQPIHLVHRDLKPANLQITRAGEVKILDFGLARASFREREADSTTNIGGTLGYIAPERLEGQEGPEGDIYSLGIVLRTLVTGVGPRHWRKFEEEGSTLKDADELAARSLAFDMLSMDPEERPTAREVEQRCEELARNMRGPTLRSWALEYVRPGVRSQDDLVGEVMSETLATVPRGVEDSQNLTRSGGPRWMLVLASLGSVGTAVVAVVVVAFVVAGAAYWVSSQQSQRPAWVPGTPDVGDLLPDPKPAPVPAPAPEPVPVPVAPKPVPVRAPAPKATFPVTFDSVPWGATVTVDGEAIGSTPVKGHALTEGDHTLRYEHGFDHIEARIQVGEGRPTTYSWQVGEPLEVRY